MTSIDLVQSKTWAWLDEIIHFMTTYNMAALGFINFSPLTKRSKISDEIFGPSTNFKFNIKKIEFCHIQHLISKHQFLKGSNLDQVDPNLILFSHSNYKYFKPNTYNESPSYLSMYYFRPKFNRICDYLPQAITEQSNVFV